MNNENLQSNQHRRCDGSWQLMAQNEHEHNFAHTIYPSLCSLRTPDDSQNIFGSKKDWPIKQTAFCRGELPLAQSLFMDPMVCTVHPSLVFSHTPEDSHLMIESEK